MPDGDVMVFPRYANLIVHARGTCVQMPDGDAMVFRRYANVLVHARGTCKHGSRDTQVNMSRKLDR